MTRTSEPVVILVHGAWHGAWCWASLQAELDGRGIASFAVDLPGHGCSIHELGDLYGDAQHVADVVIKLDRPVVLVGHSYGGAVITEAASRLQAANLASIVQHLVYLTAFALNDGEGLTPLLASLPPVNVKLGAAIVAGDDGTTTIDPTRAAAAFYASCPPSTFAAAVARLCPQPVVSFTQSVSGSPRDSIASTYVMCTFDQAIAIDHQRVMADRCTNQVTLETDHSPFTSATSATADVIGSVLNP